MSTGLLHGKCFSLPLSVNLSSTEKSKVQTVIFFFTSYFRLLLARGGEMDSSAKITGFNPGDKTQGRNFRKRKRRILQESRLFKNPGGG